MFSNRPNAGRKTYGRNTAIAKPRPAPARPIKSQVVKARFAQPNSVMNSFYQNTTFGTPGSSNRKLDVYNKPEIIKSNLTNLTTHQKKNGARTTSQARMEAQVGQMDRLARLKAKAIGDSK